LAKFIFITYNGLFIAGVQAVIVVAEDASQFSQILELSDRSVNVFFLLDIH